MASDAPLSPDFIRFLFSTKPKFDCYFEVGNKNPGKPERIGAVKLMLMAHSEVFRLELEDSDLKEKGDVPVKDVHPDTFKGMLKYVYGHDTTSDLCFDEADNMLYVAEKYMIKTLKDKLAVRLMKLLNPDNICSLLNNKACYTHLELNSAITEILRYETDRVLDSPQFLWMNADGFLKILEQDGLAVPEIELWRAAIKWAKHRAESEDGKALRQQISSFSQNLRLCALTGDDILEVIPSGVLGNEEVEAVCLSIKKKEKPQGLILKDFSSHTEPRKRLPSKACNEFYMGGAYTVVSTKDYNFPLLTKQHSIELLPLVCRSRDRDSMNPENWTYDIGCTINIAKVANQYDLGSSSANEPPITVSFSENVKCGVEFEIPLAVDGKNITLLPDTKYTVKMKFNGYHSCYSLSDSGSHSNDHCTLVLPRVSSGAYNYYYFPTNKFKYRVTTGQ